MSSVKVLNDKYQLVMDENGSLEVWHRLSGDIGVATLDDYQELADLTADDKVRNDPVYTALGMCGEAGEFAEQIKHEHYHGHEENREKKRKELGDVLWYLSMAAKKHGFKLSEIASGNVVKLAKRYPNGFTTEASIKRADGEKMT